jgi:hypothetical protein
LASSIQARADQDDIERARPQLQDAMDVDPDYIGIDLPKGRKRPDFDYTKGVNDDGYDKVGSHKKRKILARLDFPSRLGNQPISLDPHKLVCNRVDPQRHIRVINLSILQRMNVLALQKELLNLIREIHYDREVIDDTQKKVRVVLHDYGKHVL